jgi:hypothetical protein
MCLAGHAAGAVQPHTGEAGDASSSTARPVWPVEATSSISPMPTAVRRAEHGQQPLGGDRQRGEQQEPREQQIRAGGEPREGTSTSSIAASGASGSTPRVTASEQRRIGRIVGPRRAGRWRRAAIFTRS